VIRYLLGGFSVLAAHGFQVLQQGTSQRRLGSREENMQQTCLQRKRWAWDFVMDFWELGVP
jgi:hypothetical protein